MSAGPADLVPPPAEAPAAAPAPTSAAAPAPASAAAPAPTSTAAPAAASAAAPAPTSAAASASAAAAAPRRRRLRLHPAARRAVHPGAWWLWAGGLAAAAMRTTNPLLLGLILAVVAYVVAARRSSAPWSRSFSSFLKLGVMVVAVRMVLTVLFGARLPGTVVFTLPTVELPSWLAGVHLGGPVTVPMLVVAFTAGFRLAVLLACFGALNSLCSPYRLLRSLPAVLYEAGVAVTVALSFAPQAVAAIGRLREARRLRGRPTRGLASWRGLALPVLEGALDRSVALAASMDTRGYGRRGQAPASARRVSVAATVAGLLAVCVGVYGLLDVGAPRALGLPVLGIGSALLALSLFTGGRRADRTRYRPDPWAWPEWCIAASGAAALAGSLVAGFTDPAGLEWSTVPLAWPALPWAAVAGILAGLVPAVVAPLPPVVEAAPPRADHPSDAPAGGVGGPDAVAVGVGEAGRNGGAGGAAGTGSSDGGRRVVGSIHPPSWSGSVSVPVRTAPTGEGVGIGAARRPTPLAASPPITSSPAASPPTASGPVAPSPVASSPVATPPTALTPDPPAGR